MLVALRVFAVLVQACIWSGLHLLRGDHHSVALISCLLLSNWVFHFGLIVSSHEKVNYNCNRSVHVGGACCFCDHICCEGRRRIIVCLCSQLSTVSTKETRSRRWQDDFNYSNIRGRISANNIKWTEAAVGCSIGSHEKSEVSLLFKCWWIFWLFL